MAVATICSLPALCFIALTHLCVSASNPRVLFGIVTPRSVAAFLSPELMGLGQSGALTPSPHPCCPTRHAQPAQQEAVRDSPGLAVGHSLLLPSACLLSINTLTSPQGSYF